MGEQDDNLIGAENKKSRRGLPISGQIFIFSILLLIAIVYLVKTSGQKEPDDRLEMYDPDNTEMAADSMSVLYKQTTTAQNNVAICNAEQQYLQITIKKLQNLKFDSGGLVDAKNKLTEVGQNLLDQFSVRSIFIKANLDQREDVFLRGVDDYTTVLNNLLLRANVPNRIKYLSSYDRYINVVDSLNYANAATVNPVIIAQIPAAALEELKTTSDYLAVQLTTLTSTIQDKGQKFEKLKSKYLKSRVDIRKQAITWGILAFTLTAVVLYSVGVYFREKRITTGVLNKLSMDANFMQSIKDSTWISVYMITVLLLIITIFILGLAGLLQENTLAALLGGIAGYVLNNKAQTDTPAPVTPVISPQSASRIQSDNSGVNDQLSQNQNQGKNRQISEEKPAAKGAELALGIVPKNSNQTTEENKQNTDADKSSSNQKEGKDAANEDTDDGTSNTSS